MSADDRAPSPAAATPPAKRARLASPTRSPPRDTMDAAGVDGRDVPVDAVDAHGAPAATTGGVDAPAPAPTPAPKAATAAAPKKKGKRKPRHALPELCAPEDVVARDVAALLGADAVAAAVDAGTEWDAPFAPDVKEELTLEVTMLSSNGEGLARLPAPAPPWAILVPFALPGETVRARVYRHARLHSFADLVAVETPNPELRDMDRVKCRYFGACAGCQYQMLSYEQQLVLKRDVVVKAFANYFDAPADLLPPIGPTAPSPLQYGYRTKITPHFDAPPKKLARAPDTAPRRPDGRPEFLSIGFNRVGTRHVMDIEECPIATPVINAALPGARAEIAENVWSYKKGVSLIFRDSLPLPDAASAVAAATPTVAPDAPAAAVSEDEPHIVVASHRGTVRERVGGLLFEYPAHSFFQNNNAVLSPLTDYVRAALVPAPGAADAPTHLVDAYCGAGLFALALAPAFAKVAGIELSRESIAAATRNAALNGISNATFRAGDAADIFGAVPDFPPARTALVIDPPRKGTDTAFLAQLVAFAPARVVYVSCNVHTQARDLGALVRLMEEHGGGRRYAIESVRGFDLFPQTAHVESVAVLRLVDA